jgi:hypothetical protein
MMRFFSVLILCIAIGELEAQTSRKKNNSEQPSAQPSSVEPLYPEKEYQPKKKQKPTGKITYNARDEFYDQMARVAKAHRKAEKEMLKPQYSDPSYFGHKKPPKRNPAGKLKYCKECGIRH